MIRKISIGLLCMGLVVLLSSPVFAFSTIVAYGDSLTDDGAFSGLGFWNGIVRLTDGAIWVETLADSLGCELMDTAFAGATTGLDNLYVFQNKTGLQWQIDTLQPLLNDRIDMDSTLFTVWAGGNDFFKGRENTPAAANVALALEKLVDFGAGSLFTANLPDIGYTPKFYNDAQGPGTMAAASAWTTGFNVALESELAAFGGAHPDVDLYFLDVYSLYDNYIDIDSSGNILNLQEWEALFWDKLHPSEIGHDMIAQGAYDVLEQGNPVPIPATFLLLLSGLFAVVKMRR